MSAGHARLAPSSAHRWMHCPGSVTFEEGARDLPSRYAEEGTIQHLLIADRLPYIRATRTIDFSDLLGKSIGSGGIEPLTITPAHVAALESCGRAFVDESGCAPRTLALIEQRVYIPDRPDCYGTADVLIVDRPLRRLSVIDWKFGLGVKVMAKENPQAIIYALGALILLAGIEDIDTVRVVIHQPHLDHHDTWQVSADELRSWLRRVLDAARRTDVETQTYIDGDWCRFCKRKSVCPRLRATALAVAQDEFRVVENASAQELAAAMAKIPRIEAFIRAVEAEVLQRLARGETVPGYKTVEGRRSRAYTDELVAGAWARRTFGRDAFTAPALITPAALESLAKARATTVPDDVWEWHPGPLKVAPDNDDRPRRSGAQLDFAPIAITADDL